MFTDIFQAQEDPFYIFNVHDIIEKYKSWTEKLPRVKPFYGNN